MLIEVILALFPLKLLAEKRRGGENLKRMGENHK
jgi:hypothetical protein